MSTDHLVLRFDENVSEGKRADVVFVFYDHVEQTYAIRGKAGGCASIPYSFYCDNKWDVIDFLETIYPSSTGNSVLFDLTMINYSNLPYLSDDITFSMLDKGHNYLTNEIVGYDGVNTCRCDKKYYISLSKYLNVIRYVYNSYEEV